MFKAMMAAAEGKASVPPPAPRAPKPSPDTLKPPKTTQIVAEAAKPRPVTFTQLRGTQDKALPPQPSRVAKPVSTAPKKAARAPPKSTTKPLKAPVKARATTEPSPPAAPKAPRKKLNFTEILNKAKQVDGQKLAMELKTISSEDRKASRQRPKLGTKGGTDGGPNGSRSSPVPAQRPQEPSKAAAASAAAQATGPATRTRLAPAPRAQPSKELLARQQQAQDSDSMDEFIVDDDRSSYRSQVWEALGRRPPAAYEDESDSDMEANHSEIDAEEELSRRIARQEDQREERRLADLAAAKLKKKQRR